MHVTSKNIFQESKSLQEGSYFQNNFQNIVTQIRKAPIFIMTTTEKGEWVRCLTVWTLDDLDEYSF